jgi:sugar phosphate isomerase/epimerase
VPFLRALHDVDPDMAVNIEHEDTELDQIEGLRLAAENVIAAAAKARV